MNARQYSAPDYSLSRKAGMPSAGRALRRARAGLAMMALACALAGCGGEKWGFPYRASVQQGNWLTNEQISQLKVGMSREQVRFLLGSPTLNDVLHADRWDYPYYFKPGHGDAQERKFSVWFENDKLTRWEGDAQPELQPFQLDKAKSDDAAKRALDSEDGSNTPSKVEAPKRPE
jgi:outer membrane protein assembly factor BamE